MKKRILIAAVSVFSDVNAYASDISMSKKSESLSWGFGGCTAGLATGFVLADQVKNDGSKEATIGINTAIGCVTGLVASYFFVKDEEIHPLLQWKAVSKERNSLYRINPGSNKPEAVVKEISKDRCIAAMIDIKRVEPESKFICDDSSPF